MDRHHLRQASCFLKSKIVNSCAGLRPLFHSHHFYEIVGIRCTCIQDFFSEAGTSRSKALCRILPEDELYGFVRESCEKEHNKL